MKAKQKYYRYYRDRLIQSSATGNKEDTIKFMNLIDIPTNECIKMCFRYSFRNNQLELSEYLISIYEGVGNFYDFTNGILTTKMINKIKSYNLISICERLSNEHFPILSNYRYEIFTFSLKKFHTKRDFDNFMKVIKLIPNKKALEYLTMYREDPSDSTSAMEIKSKISAYIRDLQINSILT